MRVRVRVRSGKKMNGAVAGADAVNFYPLPHHNYPITIWMRFKVRFSSAVLGAVQLSVVHSR